MQPSETSRSVNERVAEVAGWIPPKEDISTQPGWCLPDYGVPRERREYVEPWPTFTAEPQPCSVAETATEEEYAARFYWKSPEGKYTEPVESYNIPPCPDYESSLDAAMTAYEVMRSLGWANMHMRDYEYPPRIWAVSMSRGMDHVVGNGPTLSAAICAAILAAAEKGRG